MRERKREQQLKLKTETLDETERKEDSGNHTRRELTKQRGRTTAEAEDREWTKERKRKNDS